MLQIQKKMTNAFYALLSLPATAMGFALSVQISALSWILSTKYGLDIHEIGIVWAAGPIAGIIAQPIVGALSDNMWFMGGRRRPWIVIGGILSALMMLALPNLEIIQKIFVGGDDPQAGLLSIAVIVALTFDLSINVSFNPTRSLVADCTPHKDRSKGYTWMQTVSGTFGVLAYFIGGAFLCNIFPLLEDSHLLWEKLYSSKSNAGLIAKVLLFVPSALMLVGSYLEQYALHVLFMLVMLLVGIFA